MYSGSTGALLRSGNRKLSEAGPNGIRRSCDGHHILGERIEADSRPFNPARPNGKGSPMRKFGLHAALLLGGAVLATSAASAGSPVALIEGLSGNPAALEVMDYLEPGQIIRLRARQTLVLSYLNSCTRERITGGTVTVGTEQSEVLLGKVERTKIRCHQAKASPTSELVIQASGHVFRGLKN
jgi:hypothetical protein